MKKITLLFIVTLVLGSIVGFSVLELTGIAFYTGSPSDGGKTCSSNGGCHSGGATVPTVSITATPAFGAGNTYVAGTTYTITVTGTGSYPKYGLGLEIIKANSGASTDAGTFGAVVTSNCKKLTSTTKPTNIVQTAASGTSNKAVFSFTWTAPSSGSAYLYCALLGVNGTGSDTGDKATTTSLTLTQNTSSSTPVIVGNTFNATLFPNPAHDFVYLNYSLKESSDVKAEIFTMEGKKSASFNYNNQIAGEHRETINLSELNLTNGIYSVSITAGNNRVTKNIVIQ
jgi:hypothetical protein